MATRLYFGSQHGVAPPAPSGTDWEHIQPGSIAFTLNRTVGVTEPLTNFGYSPDAADHITSADSCHWQFISDPLLKQTISGNIKVQIQGFETNGNDNLGLAVKVYTVSNDGTTAKSTLLAITRDPTEFVTTLANRSLGVAGTGVGFTAATIDAGDRIVIDLGMGGTITTGAGGVIGHNGTLRFGDVASGGDLPENETEIGTTFRPWVEFTRTLLFQEDPIDLPVHPDFPQTRKRFRGDSRRDFLDSHAWIDQILPQFNPAPSMGAFAQAASGYRMEDKQWLVDAGRIKGNIRRRYSGVARSRLSPDVLYPGMHQSLASYRSAEGKKTDVRRLDFPVPDWISKVVPPPAFNPNTGGWAAIANMIRLADNQEFLWWSKDR